MRTVTVVMCWREKYSTESRKHLADILNMKLFIKYHIFFSLLINLCQSHVITFSAVQLSKEVSVPVLLKDMGMT